MLSAVDAFMAVANATVAVVAKAPPYVRYHVHGAVRAAGETAIDRTVVVRSDDGVSVVHDDDTGKDELRPAFPAPPTFDALSSFKLSGEISVQLGGKGGKHRDGDMRIVNVHPLHYEATSSHADAVARSINGYVVTYADDSTAQLGHLHLERNARYTANRWLRDVWYDGATMVPTRIVWGGRDDFTLDAVYTTVDGRWLLSSIRASEVVHAPLWLGRSTIAIGGEYRDYAFSDTPPDPRLAPSPAPKESAGIP